MVFYKRKPNRCYYYVTICIKDRQKHFGTIIENEMNLNKYGKIVKKYWSEIQKHFNNIESDVFQIMPNHVHMIIIIKNRFKRNNWLQRRNILLYKIIGFLKINSLKQIHQSGLNSFQWQRSYYDYVIKNEYSLNLVRRYIRNNPMNWDGDVMNCHTIF